MRKSLLFAAAVAAALALPGYARAQFPCGLPNAQPLWIEFGHPDVEDVFVRPGTVLAVSSGEFPARVRQAGAKTVFWDMNLRNRVGIPTQPTDPATIVDRANRLFDFAAAQSACDKPVILLNELNGAHLETPWSQSNAQYRANVLTLVRTLAERGARPLLLIASPPFMEGEAREWWLEAAKYADLVQEVYFAAPTLYKQGPIVASRRLRIAFRRAVARFIAIGVPVSRLGIVLGFQTGRGAGGREGLQPAHAWFRTIKWQVLAARQVARELRFASVVSWGWASYSGSSPADKKEAGCVYLWTRNPQLCDAPAVAGRAFETSRTEGQIILGSGAQCSIGRRTIGMGQLAAVQRVTGDRDAAFSALLARLTEQRYAEVRAAEVRTAERAVIASRFRGSRAAYVSELRRAGASVSIARQVLADELRRLRIERSLPARRPSAGEVVAFYLGYPALLARRVQVRPAPWWLGRRTSGLALERLAPQRVFAVAGGRRSTVRGFDGLYEIRPLGPVVALGSVPLSQARPTIAAALASFGRRASFESWTVARQEYLLRQAICRRDDLPEPSAIRLSSYLPFLELGRA